MCQEAICTKTAFELVNLFGNVHVNIPTVRNHAIRQRPDIIYFTRKRVITMPSVRKRTHFFNLCGNVLVKRPFLRKPVSNLPIYTKAYSSGSQPYENMQRVTDLFDHTNIIY